MSEAECYVYIVTRADSGAGPVKIGIARNPSSRLKELQTASPYRLAVVHAFRFPDRHIAREVERSFHGVQHKHQAHGEWFDIHPVVAIQLMCACLNAMFEVYVGDSPQLPKYEELAGLVAAQEKLAKWLKEPTDGAHTNH